MVDIDLVYQKVLALANKEQRGYITPQEFNLFADQAQKEIFEQYFYDLNKLLKTSGTSSEYTDIITNLNEKINVFEFTGSDTTIPGDCYRLGTVSHNGRVVEEVQPDELLYIKQSPLLKPTAHRRVYVREQNNIDVYPSVNNTSSIEFTYITKPSRPSWGYFVVGGKALFDPSSGATGKTNHFDLHPSEETELVFRILKYAGISIQKDEVLGSGQGLESLQVQQEKQ
jgi:hypothetical protein